MKHAAVFVLVVALAWWLGCSGESPPESASQEKTVQGYPLKPVGAEQGSMPSFRLPVQAVGDNPHKPVEVKSIPKDVTGELSYCVVPL